MGLFDFAGGGAGGGSPPSGSGLKEEDLIKLLSEQMGQKKPVGQQSMGGGAFAPVKTDMGPIDDMAKGVGAINPVAGAASQALLGAVDGASGVLGGILAAPGRIASAGLNAIAGIKPKQISQRPPPNFGNMQDAIKAVMGAAQSNPGTPPAPAGTATADVMPPPHAGPAAKAAQGDFDRDAGANRISAIVSGVGANGAQTTAVDEAEKRRIAELKARGINPDGSGRMGQ